MDIWTNEHSGYTYRPMNSELGDCRWFHGGMHNGTFLANYGKHNGLFVAFLYSQHKMYTKAQTKRFNLALPSFSSRFIKTCVAVSHIRKSTPHVPSGCPLRIFDMRIDLATKIRLTASTTFGGCLITRIRARSVIRQSNRMHCSLWNHTTLVHYYNNFPPWEAEILIAPMDESNQERVCE